MKYAADFRRLAREALRGKWTIALVAGVIASMLGAIGSGPELDIEVNEGHFSVGLSVAGQEIISTDGLAWEHGFLTGAAVYLLIPALVTGLALFVLGSVIEIGCCRFHLDLADRQKTPEIGTLFGFFHL